LGEDEGCGPRCEGEGQRLGVSTGKRLSSAPQGGTHRARRNGADPHKHWRQI
jgi:hypothetical protein